MTTPLDLISRYREISNGLVLAIERDEPERVSELDRGLTSTFDAIISSVPMAEEDRLLLMEFLIDHLIQSDPYSNSIGVVKDRLLELAALKTEAVKIG